MTKKNKKTDIRQAVQGVINATQEDEEQKDIEELNLFYPEFEVENIWEDNKKYFSVDSIVCIEAIKTTNLLHQFNRKIDGGLETQGLIKFFDNIGLNPEIESDDPYAISASSPISINSVPYFTTYRRAFDELSDRYPEYVRDYYTTRYLAVNVTEDQIKEGIKKIAKQVDNLSTMNYVKGNLAPLIKLKLHNDRYIIASYLLFDTEGVEYLKANKIDIEEGGEAPTLED